MTDTLAAALVKAQQDMPAIEPDAVNPHFKSKFVSLDHLLAEVLPVLNKHGVAVIQLPSFGPNGEPALMTVLLHGPSGEKLESQMPLVLPKPDPQGQGSAITYARRYALAAALGISSEKDDDGQAANTAGQKPNAAAKPATPTAPPAPFRAPVSDPAKVKVDFEGQTQYKGRTVGAIHAVDPKYLKLLAEKCPDSAVQKAAALFLKQLAAA